MKSTNTYYTSKDNLKSFINNEQITDNSSLLIQVFSAVNSEDFISNLLSELTLFLPNAVIIGSTTDGEIMNGKISSAKVVLSFTQFEHTSLKTTYIEHQDNGYKSGQHVAKELVDDDCELIIAFSDGLHTNGEEFLHGIDSINNDVVVVGGLAGDNFEFAKTLVFTKEHIFTKGAVAVSLHSKHLNVHVDHSFNWHPIGNELTVTKAEGNRIYTIDGRSAVDTYAHYLGEDIAKSLPGIGMEFPIMLNRNGLDIARCMLSKEDDGSLVLASNIHTGEKIRIGFGDKKEILKESNDILQSTSQYPSESIFIYSCTARRHFMGEEVESEILPLEAIAPVSGFFTYGEFYTSDKKELLNQSMTLVSLSENDAIEEVTFDTKPHQLDITSTSISALIYLINLTTKELEDQTNTLKMNNTLITELKERMELALLGSNDGVWDWNIVDNTFYYSPRWKEMLGYEDKELPNTLATWEDRVHPDDIEKTWDDIQNNVNKETEHYENIHRLKHKDGHWVWILDRAKTQFDENGKAIRMIGTHTDISKEKEDQSKLVHQAQIIEQIHDSITTTDLKGNITSWNLGSENTFGYKASEVIGKHISILYRQEDIPMLKQYMDILRTKGIYNTDLVLVKKSKELIPISFSLSLLKDIKGIPVGIIGINKDNTKRKQIEDALLEQKNILHQQANYDSLTKLPNRTLFTNTLKERMKVAIKNKTGLALFFIDLDKFKNINDSLGHDTGDSVLKIIAKRLNSVIRKEDTLARLSGDEFTIIMDNIVHKDNAASLAEKILNILYEPIYIDNDILYISVSIGIAMYPKDAEDAKYLLKYADTAMYKAKEEGRNTYQFYSSDMTILALEHIKMKTALRQAIDNDEFVIYYQPQINAHTNQWVGIEALVRWNHPTRGLLTPDTFIPLAEETGMIVKIDQWVMKTALKQIAQYYNEGLNPGKLAVNISIKQLECMNFVSILKKRIEKCNFNPEWLELEVTESQMMKRPEEIIKKLTQINNLGIGISIDDFGTGYSSLSLLKRLPINRLKIDKSFIENIPDDQEDIAIVQAIIALAKSLKLNIIAEGVETSKQKDFLITNGCDTIQGHYFSKALSEKELKKILLKNKK